MHLVQRAVYEPGERALKENAAVAQHAREIADRAVLGEIHEVAEVAILERRKRRLPSPGNYPLRRRPAPSSFRLSLSPSRMIAVASAGSRVSSSAMSRALCTVLSNAFLANSACIAMISFGSSGSFKSCGDTSASR